MAEYNNMSLHDELEARFTDAERRRQEEDFLSRGWQPPAEQHQNLREQTFSGQKYTQAIRPPKTLGDYFADNAVDMAYGASRTLNGMTGGGFDNLGDEYGFDSRMKGYLCLLPEQERLRREELAKYLQAGGALLPVGKAARVGFNLLSVPFNAWKIGRAYDHLRQNPFSGSGQDVVARMKNHNGETVMLQRGEAIRGQDGQVIASGGDLYRATGTKSNYGLNKAIYKHDVPRGEVTRLPKYIKNKPVETSSWGQSVYENVRPDGKYRVVTSTTPKGKTISSMYKIDR